MHLENSISGSYLVCNPETVSLLSSRKFLLVAHRIGLSGGDIIPDLCLEIISILIRFPEWPVMRMME